MGDQMRLRKCAPFGIGLGGFFLALGWALAQSVGAIAPPESFQSPDRCIGPAAEHHRIDPRLLRAVLKVESDLRPWALGRNANGTLDLGMAQINSIHLPELAKHGIRPQHLFDPCVASYVAAWLLRRNIDRHGLTWFGVAAYHSLNPEHNQRYQGLLMKALYPGNGAGARPSSRATAKAPTSSPSSALVARQAEEGGTTAVTWVVKFN
ncbi:MAG: lytic transglycosylase, catalytic [Betaproteobacteria bacterium]|nr:lytic transglycosylase, catalytic [Betaproteobacteria bacterium]NBY04795.1 lytic transglycosylase, catalytic [Betaproteobacteria bacterium]